MWVQEKVCEMWGGKQKAPEGEEGSGRRTAGTGVGHIVITQRKGEGLGQAESREENGLKK